MSNFGSSVIGALIGGGLAIAAGVVQKFYADCVERRRLRVALAAEIRAVLGIIEEDKFILKLQDMVNHCRETGGAGFVPVEFNSHYDDIFRSAADRLALLPSPLVERLVEFHYAIQRMIETFQMHQRPLHPDNPFYPRLPEHEAMLNHVVRTRELGRDLVNQLEQPRQ
jgi:hypothetical protein